MRATRGAATRQVCDGFAHCERCARHPRRTGARPLAEVALAKAQLNEVKAKSRMLQQEKRNIYDQISAADDLKKQQQVFAWTSKAP